MNREPLTLRDGDCVTLFTLSGKSDISSISPVLKRGDQNIPLPESIDPRREAGDPAEFMKQCNRSDPLSFTGKPGGSSGPGQDSIGNSFRLTGTGAVAGA